MLQDKSPNCENTWKFLRHRLDEGKAILSFLSDSEEKTKKITNTLGSAFTTVKIFIKEKHFMDVPWLGVT